MNHEPLSIQVQWCQKAQLVEHIRMQEAPVLSWVLPGPPCTARSSHWALLGLTPKAKKKKIETFMDEWDQIMRGRWICGLNFSTVPRQLHGYKLRLKTCFDLSAVQLLPRNPDHFGQAHIAFCTDPAFYVADPAYPKGNRASGPHLTGLSLLLSFYPRLGSFLWTCLKCFRGSEALRYLCIPFTFAILPSAQLLTLGCCYFSHILSLKLWGSSFS